MIKNKTKQKILIVEDEPIIASDIEMILEELNYEVTDICENTIDAVESIKKKKPDLILIDINLNGDTDGILLAQDVNEYFGIPFIYLTSNTDKLTINRVKRTNPSGFIVKPFTEKDLETNIAIALYTLEEKQPKSLSKTKDFFIKDGNQLIKIKIEELILAKADGNYTQLITTNKKYLISYTLKKVAEKMNTKPFIRIHRSYIVNVNFISLIQEGIIVIENYHIPIGRSFMRDFNNYINKL